MGLPEMSATQWWLLAAAAVLVFWMVGAYNRLVALRKRIAAAWQQLDAALQQRAAVLPPLLAALAGPMAAEQAALQALGQAHEGARQAAATLGGKPISPSAALGWAQAEAELQARGTRVLALLEHEPAARNAPAVAALLLAWREADTARAFARKLFDAEAQAYNAALRQWPTRLLARLYRFEPAGLLGG